MTDETARGAEPKPLIETDCEFWMVWNKGGPSRVTHQTEARAIMVAREMANRHQKTFFVVKAYRRISVRAPEPPPHYEPIPTVEKIAEAANTCADYLGDDHPMARQHVSFPPSLRRTASDCTVG